MEDFRRIVIKDIYKTIRLYVEENPQICKKTAVAEIGKRFIKLIEVYPIQEYFCVVPIKKKLRYVGVSNKNKIIYINVSLAIEDFNNGIFQTIEPPAKPNKL